MLVLSRHQDESIVIVGGNNDIIVVTNCGSRGDSGMRIGIHATMDWKIYRRELEESYKHIVDPATLPPIPKNRRRR